MVLRKGQPPGQQATPALVLMTPRPCADATAVVGYTPDDGYHLVTAIAHPREEDAQRRRTTEKAMRLQAAARGGDGSVSVCRSELAGIEANQAHISVVVARMKPDSPISAAPSSPRPCATSQRHTYHDAKEELAPVHDSLVA